MTLQLQPITFPEASAFIAAHHRHHLPSVGWKFGIAVAQDVESALAKCWSRDTSSCPDHWTEANPSRGQCAITALIIQDEYGGDLLRKTVAGESHYFNRLADGRLIDLTGQQFAPDAEESDSVVRDRSYVLSFPATVNRYESLKRRVDAARVVGVVTVGRPVARMLDNGWTLEVTRCCTDGTRNACSMLYGAAWRAAKALGYRRLITYTLASEPGTSLIAAGWKSLYTTDGHSTHHLQRTDGRRPRVDAHPLGQKTLWEVAS